ncbi:MAG: PAS domain-containing protein [Spirochaetales bacterium]|jgi:PAS domain S-box-containing protein|nr:PAS domain-containing protein [Spirochaetales bacterium]
MRKENRAGGRKKNEALEKARELTGMFSETRVGVILKDAQGLIYDWNAGAEQIFGYTRQDMIGKRTRDYASEQSFAAIEETDRRVLCGENVVFAEINRTHKDGRTIVCSASYTPVLDETGRVAGLMSLFHDISEQKRIEKTQEDLRSLFVNLVENLSTPLVLFKLIPAGAGGAEDLEIILANRSFAELNDAPYEGLRGRRFTDVCLAAMDYLPSYITTAKTRLSDSHEGYNYGNKKYLHDVAFSPTQDQVAVIVTDRTRQVEAEEALKKREDDLAQLFSSLESGLCMGKLVRDERGEPVDLFLELANQTFEVMEGLGSLSVAGKKISEVPLEEKEKYGPLFIDVAANHKKVNFTKSVAGSRRVLDVVGYSPRQDYFVCIETDITRRVRLQAELEQALRSAAESAELASRMKTNFLANMSHEIRTPLNGVIGFTELALDSEDIPASCRGYLSKIRTSAVGLLDIINDILDISKIEAGKVELEHISFSLSDVCRQCETVNGIRAREKGITLRVDILPRRLLGDPTKLRQVLLNLLSNAIKFTDSGSVRLEVREEESGPDWARLFFSVSDTGIGMTQDQVERIFEPFMQADGSMTRRYGGPGLGLSISRNLIELMGGRLRVTSKPDAGSVFSFSLRFELAEEADEENHEKLEQKMEQPVFSGDVLVCEDSILNQEVAERHLQKLGLRVTLADNGRAGVDAAVRRMKEGRPFDLILMDVHMPLMSGLEAARELAALSSPTPIVAMTASVMSGETLAYREYGMSGWLGKPFVAQDLWACLLKFLEPVKTLPLKTSEATDSPEPEDGVLDTARGLQMATGDKTLYDRLKRFFYKRNKKFFAELCAAIASKDISLAHRMVHTQKAGASLIGAQKLSEAAALIEKALADGEARYTAQQLKDYEKALDNTLAVLAPLDTGDDDLPE